MEPSLCVVHHRDNHNGWAEQQLARNHDQPLLLAVGIYRPHSLVHAYLVGPEHYQLTA